MTRQVDKHLFSTPLQQSYYGPDGTIHRPSVGPNSLAIVGSHTLSELRYARFTSLCERHVGICSARQRGSAGGNGQRPSMPTSLPDVQQYGRLVPFAKRRDGVPCGDEACCYRYVCTPLYRDADACRRVVGRWSPHDGALLRIFIITSPPPGSRRGLHGQQDDRRARAAQQRAGGDRRTTPPSRRGIRRAPRQR